MTEQEHRLVVRNEATMQMLAFNRYEIPLALVCEWLMLRFGRKP